MTKISLFLTGLMITGVAGGLSATTASAQTAAAVDESANQPPPQTLFQEETAAKPSADPSSSAPTAAPSATATPSAPVADSAPQANTPPSLSDFLTETTGANPDSADAKNPNGAGDKSAVDGVNPDAPGLDLEISSQGKQKEDPEVAKAKAEAAIRKDAFKSATNQVMPMKPSEIRRVLEMYDETTQSVETPVYPTPEPESAFQTVSLDPGAKPLLIKTAMGQVTTLSIVDITGQPWPIQDLTWAGDFQVEQPDAGSHMLRITPTSEFASGNVSMRLVGLNPPVIFSLKTERKSVHVRLDAQIPEVGPKGVLPPVDVPVTTKAGDEFLTSVLMGVVKGSDVERLKVDGVDGRTSAYNQGGMMYVRTPYTMLSPAWTKSVQSADGTKVYALNYTPVVLLSDKGKMVRAYLSHKETSNEQY